MNQKNRRTALLIAVAVLAMLLVSLLVWNIEAGKNDASAAPESGSEAPETEQTPESSSAEIQTERAPESGEDLPIAPETDAENAQAGESAYRSDSFSTENPESRPESEPESKPAPESGSAEPENPEASSEQNDGVIELPIVTETD